MKKLTIILTAFILILPLPAVAGPKPQDRKTRRQLEKENIQLRERLESIQQELDWLRADKTERDSLERQLEALYREDRNKAAAGMDGSVDFFDSPVEFQEDAPQESNLRDLGKTFRVLVEGPSKRSPEELCGRNSQNKMCVWPDTAHKAGDFVDVVVTGCTQATLLCKLA